MAIIDITTKECVENISEDDTIFVTYQGHLMQIKKSNLHDISKLDVNQGVDNIGKILKISSEGNIEPSEFPFIPDEVLIDNTLTTEGQAADAKKVGDELNVINTTLDSKANVSDIPEKLPNNFKLKFTGAVNDEYDGSSEKTINIPEEIDISNTSVSFLEAENCSNINTNETVSTIFGKIKKIFSSIKSVAYSNDYNDLLNTPSTMSGATSEVPGTQGFVPAPNSGDENSYLKGDGTWSSINNMSVDVMEGATDSTDGKSGTVPTPTVISREKYLKGDATWDDPTDKIYEKKLVTLDEIDLVTEQGFFVDALAVKQLNSNFLEEEINYILGSEVTLVGSVCFNFKIINDCLIVNVDFVLKGGKALQANKDYEILKIARNTDKLMSIKTGTRLAIPSVATSSTGALRPNSGTGYIFTAQDYLYLRYGTTDTSSYRACLSGIFKIL